MLYLLNEKIKLYTKNARNSTYMEVENVTIIVLILLINDLLNVLMKFCVTVKYFNHKVRKFNVSEKW